MAKATGDNQALLQKMQGGKKDGGNAVTQTVKSLLNAPATQARFKEILRDRAPQYMSSIINLVNSDPNLKQCEPMSVIAACMVAATLDLPVDRNLGYAWVIPYRDNKTGRMIATFQMGYKGYIQLALRTAKYKAINAIPIHEGELVSWNPLTEELVIDFDARKSDAVIGYAGYFELVNGFKKTVYWTIDQIKAHRDRFSKQPNGKVWREDFDAMALKTVIRNMLSKWGILSIEMQKAYTTDERAPVTSQESDNPLEVDWQYVDAADDEGGETDGAEKAEPASDAPRGEQPGLGIDDEAFDFGQA